MEAADGVAAQASETATCGTTNLCGGGYQFSAQPRCAAQTNARPNPQRHGQQPTTLHACTDVYKKRKTRIDVRNGHTKTDPAE